MNAHMFELLDRRAEPGSAWGCRVEAGGVSAVSGPYRSPGVTQLSPGESTLPTAAPGRCGHAAAAAPAAPRPRAVRRARASRGPPGRCGQHGQAAAVSSPATGRGAAVSSSATGSSPGSSPGHGPGRRGQLVGHGQLAGQFAGARAGPPRSARRARAVRRARASRGPRRAGAVSFSAAGGSPAPQAGRAPPAAATGQLAGPPGHDCLTVKRRKKKRLPRPVRGSRFMRDSRNELYCLTYGPCRCTAKVSS